MHLKGRAKT